MADADSKPTVGALLDAEKEAGRTWLPATLETKDGKYVVTFDGSIDESMLSVSSTGKSLTALIRADFGRSKHPIVVHRANGSDTVREFGSFNINLTLK